MSQTLEIIPCAPIGAEVDRVDLSDLNESSIAAIKEAWYRYDVLLFRNQQLSDDALLSFSRHFGELDMPPNQGVGVKSPLNYPNIFVVSNVLDERGEPIGSLGAGEAVWHTDLSYHPKPPTASILYALEIPPSGGDTWFASMKAALAALPPELIEQIKRRDVKHDATYDSTNLPRKGVTPCDDPRMSAGFAHPIIIEHPVSHEWALYFSRRRNSYIMGLELDESERLLNEIWKRIEVAVYRHKWSVGDLLLWDNRTVMHRRDAFDPRSRRVMHRTQIKGTDAPRRPVF
jgi:taurine dioxygenase